jgi:hypothetical protein
MMRYVLHMYMTFDRGPEGTVRFQYKNKLEPTYDLISHMPKTAFENIEPIKSYRRRTDGRTDGRTDILVIPIKGFHPLIINGQICLLP